MCVVYHGPMLSTQRMYSPDVAKTARLTLRVTEHDAEMIRRAADAAGKTVTDFVLDVVRIEADHVLAERRVFLLDDDAWDELQRRLAEPPRYKPRLAKLLAQPDMWSD